MRPEVSLCIPTYKAADFISDTLQFAQAQTYPNLKILVSIDGPDDGTAAICQAAAESDSRVTVFTDNQKPGWSGNVNFLMSKVESPLFAMYWHDDQLPADYVEVLVEVLEKNPTATGVRPSTVHIGAETEHFSEWEDITGTPFERIATLLLSGAVLGAARFLMRSEVIGRGLHVPGDDGRDYPENSEPFSLQVIAAGDFLYAPKAVYRRRHDFESSVTAGWRNAPFDEMFSAFQRNVRECQRIIRGRVDDKDERDLLTYCLYLFLTLRFRAVERRLERKLLTRPAALSGDFSGLPYARYLDRFPPEFRGQVCEQKARLYFAEGLFWTDRNEQEKALQSFLTVAILDPHHPHMADKVRSVLRAVGNTEAAAAITDVLMTRDTVED